jgi:hypothetical protein
VILLMSFVTQLKILKAIKSKQGVIDGEYTVKVGKKK